MKLKILTLLGTRPEIIRLSRIICELDENFKHILVNSNQNFDTNLNKIFVDTLKIRKPDYDLKCKNDNSVNFISKLLIEFDKVLIKEKPDAVLVLGDTNTGLAVLAAKKRKIPIFHLEAGNRSYDMRVPEEINRKVIDHLSDVNLTYSEIAKNNLLRENFPPDRVIKVGSPLYEVLNYYEVEIVQSNILEELKIKKDNYFLLSSHREENLEDLKNFESIVNTISYLNKKFKLPIIVTTHPRLRNKINKKIINKNSLVRFKEPFNYFEYVKLQKNAKLTLSDSGSIIEESNILNFPAINFRTTTERQEGLEKGYCIMSGMNQVEIEQSIELMLNDKNGNIQNTHSDYIAINLSKVVSKIIQSYVGYINKKVWLK